MCLKRKKNVSCPGHVSLPKRILGCNDCVGVHDNHFLTPLKRCWQQQRKMRMKFLGQRLNWGD